MRKTNKAVKQRIKITGKGKFMRRHIHQDHFNAKDTGDQTRQKRGYMNMPKKIEKNLKQQLPYC